MITIVADHDIEGQVALLWDTLVEQEWLKLVPMRKVTFRELGIPEDSPDRTVWRLMQAQGMYLLTGNRNMRDADALEKTLRDENFPASLPVFTVGSVKRLVEREYRVRCIARLMEVLLEIENYRGVGRVFIP
jgi:hypothetical protein